MIRLRPKTGLALYTRHAHSIQLRMKPSLLQRSTAYMVSAATVYFPPCIEFHVGGFELVDVSETLPSLARRPGMSTWRPAVDRDANMSFASYKEYCEYFNATFNKNSDSGRGNDPTDATSEGRASHGRKDRTRGQERDRPVRNKMLPTHWPPDNAAELQLERW